MPNVIDSGLNSLLPSTAFWAALAHGDRSDGPRFPKATLATVVVIALPTFIQLTLAPDLLFHLRRDRSAIGHGQLWRLVTSLVVQDGKWSGAIFNLVSLILIGTFAERLFGPRRWLVLAFAAGVGAQGWGLVVQPVGAGNSVMNFGLAAGIAVAIIRSGNRPAQFLSAVSLAAGIVLLVILDIHGGAAFIGALVASRFDLATNRRSRGGCGRYTAA